MTVRRTASLLAALVLLPACAGGPPATLTADASSGTVATDRGGDELGDPPPDGADAPAGDPEASSTTVTLVDAGEEPRRVLRYDFRSAPATPVGGTLTATFGIGGGDGAGETLPDRAPMTVAAPTEVTVLEVDDAGTATVTFGLGAGRLLDHGGLSEGTITAIERTIAGLADVSATYRIDGRGFATGPDPEASTGSPVGPGADVATIARRLRAFVQPLPEQPVGPGAVWNVTTSIDLGGVVVRHTVAVELLEHDGNVVELLYTVEDVTPAGPIVVTEPFGSAPVQIRSLSLDGGGNVTARLDRPLPLGASQGLTASLLLDTPGGNGRAGTTVTILSDASLESDG